MRRSKIADIMGTLLLFIGFFFAFLPHVVHTKFGLNNETPHLRHVIFGLIIVAFSLGILVYNNKAWKAK